MTENKTYATRKQFELATRYAWGDDQAKILFNRFSVPIVLRMTAERMFMFGATKDNFHANVVRSLLTELEENGFISFLTKEGV